MIKLKSNNFKCKREWQIIVILTALYTVFLISKYIRNHPEIWNYLNNSFLFYLDGTISNYKKWYPRFGFWFFSLVLLIKCFSAILSLFGLYFFFIQIKELFYSFVPNDSFSFTSILSRQVAILICILGYYIGLYFIFRYYFSCDFLNFQIHIARGFLLQLCFQIISNITKYRVPIAAYLKNFFLEPQLPYSISIFRILFFSYLAFIYYIEYSMLPTVSLSNKVPLPLIGWLIDILPINADIYICFLYLGIVCCLFIVIGFKTRFFLIINSICVFYIIATPNFFGKLWHEQFVIWIVWFFMFSRCYDVFSIDAFINKTAIVKSANYTFPIRFVWIQFGIIYFWAGFYKLWDSGFEWSFGSSMINQVQLEWVQAYDKVPGVRIDQYPIVLYLGGLLVIIFELAYILFVLRPKWRWISFFGGLLMHNLIGYFMYISFRTLLQIFYIFYIDFNSLFSKIKSKFAIQNGFSKVSLFSGISILIFNFFFGMFHIDTYPFSSYPSYSAIIPDQVKIIEFRSKNLNKTVHQIGLENHFRWEDYGWLEDNLIKDFQSGKDVNKRLADYWQIWVKRNPQLQSCDTVEVYLTQRPVAPEGKNKKVRIKKMGIIINNSNN